MADSYSDYLERKALDHVWGGPDFARPATIYFGLSSTAVAEHGGNNTEPAGNNYARVAVINNAANFPAAAGTPSQKTVAVDVTFPVASAAWAGAGIQQIEATMWDALAGGNFLGSITLRDNLGNPAGREVLANDQVYFPAGSLVIGQA